ncbi:MAG: hypothetical protein KY392_03685, partial [Chloroflexi bacterium]|nr:hypothetical protein [Chloroflexota bacterium]
SPVATPTVAPTPVPTPSPTASETATSDATDDGGSGSGLTGSLIDALPDEVGGFPRNDMEGMEQFILPMLQQQGIDADEADFAFASWGEGEETLIVTAMRMPGVTPAQLELIGRMMGSSQRADVGTEVEAETVTVAGKQVLRVTPADAEGEVLIYIVGDAFFTVISQTPSLAEELLQQLP